MRKKIIVVMILFYLFSCNYAFSQRINSNDASRIATNWITTIIFFEGDWGGSGSAIVQEVQELKLNERVVGYLCSVIPEGYIVVALRKELTPVKAYSTSGYLNPESEVSIASLLKKDMENSLNVIESHSESNKTELIEELKRLPKANQTSSWNKLDYDPQNFKVRLESRDIVMEYKEGTWLLGTNWHQKWPYNMKCPNYGCTAEGLRYHALVGCAATAAAQIMRYWSWPPSYDWLNMPISVTPTSDEERDAVATLSHDAGVAAGMDYGCNVSTIITSLPMVDALDKKFVYTAFYELGVGYNMSAWHDFLKTELNANRPVLYGNGGMGHTYVVDGWKQVDSLYWHINMGWESIDTIWYTRDYWPSTDDMVRITPKQALYDPTLINDRYDLLTFPYRYFIMDCSAINNTIFGAGQNLQFLPGVKVKCNGAFPNIYTRFEGNNVYNTRLFSIKGTQPACIKIYGGAIELKTGGGLTFLSRQIFSD